MIIQIIIVNCIAENEKDQSCIVNLQTKWNCPGFLHNQIFLKSLCFCNMLGVGNYTKQHHTNILEAKLEHSS